MHREEDHSVCVPGLLEDEAMKVLQPAQGQDRVAAFCLPIFVVVQSTRNFEENPWMTYCKLFNLCFLYLLTSSQPEPFIFPFISPLPTLTGSESGFLMNCLDLTFPPAAPLLMMAHQRVILRAQGLESGLSSSADSVSYVGPGHSG